MKMNKYEVSLELDKIINIVSSYAKTSYAKEKILNLEANNDLTEIKKALNETNEALNLINKLKEIEIYNLNNANQTLQRLRLEAFLNIEDCINLYNILRSIDLINVYQKDLKALNAKIEYLESYFANIIPDRNLSVDLSLIFDDDFNIKDNASLTLLDIRKKTKLQESAIRNKINELLAKYSKMLNDNIIAYRDGRMCLPVKEEAKNQIKGMYHGQSSSGTTIYIEPLETLEISNRILELKNMEKEEISRILMNFSTKAWSHYESLYNSYNNMIELDFIFAKALYAKEIDGNMPKINNNGKTNLIKAYHPLIERSKCIPIDINIGDKFDCIIVTGPNTGGKTVSLKTFGLISLMIKYGLLVPVETSSEVNIFRFIYADIDNIQSIEQSLSTFSANMKNVIEIIDDIKPNSLVLFDELGSGTDPKEGSSLAISIIEYLLKKNAKIICTTHYSDLKAYAYNSERIINASVEFDAVTLKPTYKLLLGISGASNALTIANRLGLKEEIINNAKHYSNVDSNEYNNLLANVEKLNEELVNERKKLVEREAELEIRQNNINKQEQELVDKFIKFENNAKEKAEKIIIDAKNEANSLLEEIREIKRKENIKTNELADVTNKVNNLINKEMDIIDFDLKIGDTVLIKSYNQVGTIIRMKKDQYEVKMGNLTISVKKDDLAPHYSTNNEVKKKVLPKEIKNNRGVDEVKSYKLELDLRGFRYEEVKPALEKFIDQAYLAHINQVYVIHGFGTGAVRKACYDYFKSSPYVKDVRFGREGEGLNGVSVVTLK